MRLALLSLVLFTSVGHAAPPTPVKGPDLAKPIELILPSEPDDAVLAGNGRYIAFTCPEAKKFAIVDVTEGSLVKELPMVEDDQRIVGTLSRLWVYTPRARSFQGYKLGTFAEDGKGKPLPKTAPGEAIESMLAAPATDGLILLHFPKAKLTAGFLPSLPNPAFGALNWKKFGPRDAHGPHELRISNNGTLLIGWGGGYAGMEAAVIRNNRAEVWDDQYKYGPVDWAVPSADGQFIYTPGGHLTRTMTYAGGQKKDEPYMFPNVDAGFYFAAGGRDPLLPPERSRGGETKRNRYGSGSLTELTLFTAENQKIVGVHDDTLSVKMVLPPEKRVFFYNSASLLATVGGIGKKRVKIQRLDVKDELERAGGEYLVVTSAPPTATRGSKFSYPVGVLSKKGSVTLKLDRSPTGMRVNGTSLVWDVPVESKDRYASFQLSVSDANGKSIIHLGQVVIVNP